MILDSCVLIDVSRHKPDAVAYVGGLVILPSVSVLSVTEVLSGVRNQREQRLFERMFESWIVIDVDDAIARLAARWLKQWQLYSRQTRSLIPY